MQDTMCRRLHGGGRDDGTDSDSDSMHYPSNLWAYFRGDVENLPAEFLHAKDQEDRDTLRLLGQAPLAL